MLHKGIKRKEHRYFQKALGGRGRRGGGVTASHESQTSGYNRLLRLLQDQDRSLSFL